MADTSVELNPGTGGAVIDTRTNAAAEHRQVIVIGEGAAQSDAVIPGDAANGLDVDVTRVQGTVAVSNAGLTELAAAIDTELQVDVVGALPAGNNNIGDVDVASLPALPAGNNNIGDVDVVSSALPTGAATAANQTTIIGHLDGVEGLLTTIDSDTGLISGAIKAEDSAHTSTDTGIMALGVRKDADGAFGADLDYSPLQLDDNGYLKVNIKAGAGSGGTAATDDAAFTAASGSGTPMMGFVTADSVDSGDVGVVGMLANRQLKVTLYDSAGAELAVGGGTQYTEDAAAAANPIGNALNLVRDDARTGSLTTTDGDNVAARGTNAGELYVKHVDAIPVTDNSSSLTVDGTVTANAGTNLNTSALALETGGNLAAAAASLAIVDDWDESDRAKVNPIAGQAGVQGASGTVTALTQRVVLATDVALPAGTNGIGKLTANSGVDIGDVDVTSISAGTNAIGNVGLIGRTTGGMTIFRSIDLDETEEEVKATAGQVFSIAAFNRTATPLYLKFYNATAANVTVGTTTPVLTFVVPANADSDGAGFIWNNAIGFAFGTAITVACTTGVADADTGAPGANECIVNIGYT